MIYITDKMTPDILQKTRPKDFEKARGAIGLAESFPVKGGDVVPKKGGGWFESLRNNSFSKEKE